MVCGSAVLKGEGVVGADVGSVLCGGGFVGGRCGLAGMFDSG